MAYSSHSPALEDWTSQDFDLNGSEPLFDRVDTNTQANNPTDTATVISDQRTDQHDDPIQTNQEWADSDPQRTIRSYTQQQQQQEEEEEEEEEEQSGTIKLSNAQSSALKQLIQARNDDQDLQTFLRPTDPAVLLRPPLNLDWNWSDDFDLPDAVTSDLNLFHHPITYTSDVDSNEQHIGLSGSASTTTSTSYKSFLGLSTDFTEPDSPFSKASARQAPGSSTSSVASSLVSPCHKFRGLGDAKSLGLEPDSEVDLEHDFELDPTVQTLNLCPTISRQRSHSTLEHDKLLWGEDCSANTSLLVANSGRSSDLRSDAGQSHDAASPRNFSGESDADDEQEDILEGLELNGSAFETSAIGSEISPQAIKQKLEAILNVKRIGGLSESDRATWLAPKESETDLAAGLVITDDLDLSPSRLPSRKLTFRTRTRGPAQMNQRQAQPSRHTSQPIGPGLRGSFYSPQTHFPRRDQIFSPSPRIAACARDPSLTLAPQDLLGKGAGHMNAGATLRYKRSASDLQTSKTASGSTSLAHARSKGLSRKRSLPSLADPNRQTTKPVSYIPTEPRSTTTGPRSSNTFSSRLTASTAASRARAAETAADSAARLARDMAAPARPSTPVSTSNRSHHVAPRISVKTKSAGSVDTDRQRSFQTSRSLRAESISPLRSDVQPVAHFLRRSTTYANGKELDGFDDLPSGSVIRNRTERLARSGSQESTSGASLRKGKRKQAIKPGLIQSLGTSPATQKFVKGMRWNPSALRWEGNESVLGDFDRVVQSSTRPALISQLTGSSTNSAMANWNGIIASPLSANDTSLMANIACGAKVVGDMLFDPVQMRWISCTGEEELDIFASIEFEGQDEAVHSDTPKIASALSAEQSGCQADESTDEDRESNVKARRIKSADVFRKLDERWTQGIAPKPKQSKPQLSRLGETGTTKTGVIISKALAEGSFPELSHVEKDLWEACIEAESRHGEEVHGFFPKGPQTQTYSSTAGWEQGPSIEEIDRPRPHLYYLTKVAKNLSKASTSPQLPI